MDYKTNILNKEIEVQDVLIPEIPGLYFCELSKEKIVFDYTAYLTENEIEPVDYKLFMRLSKPYIEAIIETAQTSELFYLNKNNHILVDAELVFLFLTFVNKQLGKYFNNILADALMGGVAYSNGFIYNMAIQRLPSDILKEIIEERERNDSTNE